MQDEIKSQIILMAIALSLGNVAGFLFDIYRRLRNLLSPGPITTFIGDLAFWMIMTMISFLTLIQINSGQVRGYIFLGIVLGLGFYWKYLSNYVISSFVYINIFTRYSYGKIAEKALDLKKLKIFALPKRILEDAQRIYRKIKQR